MSSSDEEKRIQLIFDLVKTRFESELQRTNEIDSKVSSLIGYVGTITGILSGFGGFIFVSGSKLTLGQALVFLFGLGILVVSLVFGLWAYRVRRWQHVPDPRHLIETFAKQDILFIMKEIAVEMTLAYEKNLSQNDNKARATTWAWFFLLIGIGAVFIFVVAAYLKLG